MDGTKVTKVKATRIQRGDVLRRVSLGDCVVLRTRKHGVHMHVTVATPHAPNGTLTVALRCDAECEVAR